MTVRVRVSDSGHPPRSAVRPLRVEVLDENDNPPSSRALRVVVRVYEGNFAGGPLFLALPRDPDRQPASSYRCRLSPGHPPEGIFRVAAKGCLVSAGRIQNAREYDLGIVASDGSHPEVEVRARLNFVPFARAALGQVRAMGTLLISSLVSLGKLDKTGCLKLIHGPCIYYGILSFFRRFPFASSPPRPIPPATPALSFAYSSV